MSQKMQSLTSPKSGLPGDKKLRAIYQISTILSQSNDVPEKVLDSVIGILASTFSPQHKINVTITIDDRFYGSVPESDSLKSIKAALNSTGKKFGKVAVFHSCGPHCETENPFSKSDRLFLRTVASQISFYARSSQYKTRKEKSDVDYHSLMNTVSDVIFELNHEGKILFTNNAVTSISGFTPEELAGKYAMDFLFPHNENQIYKNLTKLRKGESITFDQPFFAKGSKAIWARVTTTPKMINGKILGYSGTMSDISNLKEAEESSRNHNLFQELLITISNRFINVHADGLENAINRSLRDLGVFIDADRSYLFDYDFQEGTHTNTNEWCTEGITPEIQKLKSVPNSLMPYQINLHKRGDSVFIPNVTEFSEDDGLRTILLRQGIKCVIAVPILDGAACTGFVGFDSVKDYNKFSYREQTLLRVFAQSIVNVRKRISTEEELFKSEKRLSEIAAHSRTVTWEIDPEGLFTYVSPVCEKVWGYTTGELTGKIHFYDLFPENLREIFKAEQLSAIAEGKRIIGFEKPVFRKDGVLIWVISNGGPIYNDRHEVVGYRGGDSDITERKVAEEALRKSEESLNYAQKIAQMASWEFNVKTGVAFYSKNYFSVLGIPAQEKSLRLEEIKKLVHPDDRSLFEENVQLLGERKGLRTFDFRIMSPSGLKWIQANIAAKFENGELIMVHGVSIDITEKREAEEKIRQQNIRLNAILEALPVMLFVIDSKGEFKEFYSSASRQLLIPAEKIAGSNLKDIFGDEISFLHLQKINDCLNSRSHISFEYFTKVSDVGLSFEATLTPYGEDTVLALVSDISKRKKDEERLRELNTAIEYSPAAIVISDLNGVIKYVSPAFTSIYGYTSDEIIGRNARLLKSGKTSKETYKKMWDTITNGRIWQGEWQNKKKNHEIFWESTTISPIPDGKGNIQGYLSIKQDTTEKKLYEQQILDLNANLELRIIERTQQLEAALKEAERANLAKSEFLSRVSHELRTPMHSILGFSQLLQMGGLNAGQEKSVANILKSGNHLLSLINDVLDLTRIDTGNGHNNMSKFHLDELLSDSISSLAPAAEKREITITLKKHAEESFPPIFYSDSKKLKQVFINFISNAIKYNRHGGTVEIRYNKVPQPGGKEFLRIEFSDSGNGIPEQDIPKLFTAFQRIGAEKTDIEGTGLGLAVVKSLIESLGGIVGVTSKLNNGSTFWLEIPYEPTALI